MLRGVYTAAAGMLVESLKTDVTANNLANAETHGFKRQSVSVRSFPEMLLHRINDAGALGNRDPRPTVGYLGTGAAIDELALQMTPGTMRYTGRKLDVAIEGPGFLSVMTPEGDEAFTRDGNLHVDGEGYLATEGGLRVAGDAGPIYVGDSEPYVDEEGRVWLQGDAVATLRIAEFAEPRALERLGNNLVQSSTGSGPPQAAVASVLKSGYLEEANVNVVREMVNMITTQRAYEANQKILQTQDETLGRLINEAATLA